MPKGKIGGNNARPSNIVLANSEVRQSSYPDTELKILEVAKMICDGKSKDSCLKYIMDTKDVGLPQAKQYYNAAVNFLIPEDEDEYRKQMLAKNFRRLEQIIEKGMTDDRDLRLAKEAIAELNKMCGIGGNKVTVAKNRDGDEMIQISFD